MTDNNTQRDSALKTPLVSVVTPVYNGAKYLHECIESVLAQTYQHWEYIIVDNCSTDETSEIAQTYARREARIRIVRNPRLVSIAQNHQIGFQHMATHSKYCKVVHADDSIFPDCVRQMVALAEAHSTVGIVSAYRVEGTWAGLGGLGYPSTVFSGREACRKTLLKWAFVFGTPSSLLVRSECIRQRQPFYDEEHFPQHFDTAACLEVLRDWDFGFVHQTLTHTRKHDEARTPFSWEINSHLAEGVAMLMKYGSTYLERAEGEEILRQWVAGYRRFLANNMLRRRDEIFWNYHRTIVGHLGWSLNPVLLFTGVLSDSVASSARRFGKLIGLKPHSEGL
jgi:glycosyltransferase involved in cell wall biosynthesis